MTEAQRHADNIRIAAGTFAEWAKKNGDPLTLDIALTLAKAEVRKP